MSSNLSLRDQLSAMSRDELNIVARKLRVKSYRKLNKDVLVRELLLVDDRKLRAALNITFWDKYHNHVYGWASIIGVVISVVLYLLPGGDDTDAINLLADNKKVHDDVVGRFDSLESAQVESERNQSQQLQEILLRSEEAAGHGLLKPGDSESPGGRDLGRDGVFFGNKTSASTMRGGVVLSEGNDVLIALSFKGDLLSATLNLFDKDGVLVVEVSDQSKLGGSANEYFVNKERELRPQRIGTDRLIYRAKDGVTVCDIHYVNRYSIVIRGEFYTRSGRRVSISDEQGLLIDPGPHLYDMHISFPNILHLSPLPPRN